MLLGPYLQEPIKTHKNLVKPYKKNTSSITKTSFFSLNEIQISQRILQIPNYSRYFSPVLKNSFVNFAEIDDENFERYKKIGEENSYILITRLNVPGSRSFYEVFYANRKKSVETGENIIKIKITDKTNNLIKTNKMDKINTVKDRKEFLKLINSYKHLLEGANLLNNGNIVNINFHPSTLVFRDNLPVIERLDECFHFPTINEERKSYLFSDYQAKNMFLPLEAHVICFLIDNKLDSLSFSSIEEICEDCRCRIASLSCFSNAFLDKYKETAHFSLQALSNKPKNEIIHEMLQKCTTWNNYGISILFLVLLRDIFKGREGFPQNSFFSQFSQILVQGIHPIPDKRPSILQNISLFNDILYNTSVENYDKLLSLFASLSGLL
uniref:Protein kinase domain-containing protein n=1 Tax=viral metagenome TaxID=1070528 RepID=A0A6C0JYK4_9ZZZZ